MFVNSSIAETINTTYDIVSFPNETEDYFWRVLATDARGDNSSFSELRNITIRINRAPNTPSSIIFNSTTTGQSNYTNETLTANFVCNDPDDDVLTYDLTFYKDGIANFSLTSLNCNSEPSYISYTFDSANTSKLELWSFNVNISDDDSLFTETIFSNNITIANYLPTIPTLNSPTNNSLITDNTPTLNWNNVTGDIDNDEITYYLEVWNNTALTESAYINTSVSETTSPTQGITSTLTDDNDYYWRVLAYDGTDNTSFSEFFNFSLDATTPVVSIIYPITDTTYSSQVRELNYTFVEANLNSCSYSINSGVTNISITCGDNVTGLTSADGDHIWRVYITDLAGNEGSASTNFTVSISKVYETVVVGSLYKRGDNVTIAVALADASGDASSSEAVIADIYYPNNSLYVDDLSLPEIGSTGVYRITHKLENNVPYGDYLTVLSSSVFSATTLFQVKPIEDYLNEINQSTKQFIAWVEAVSPLYANEEIQVEAVFLDETGNTVTPSRINLTILDPNDNNFDNAAKSDFTQGADDNIWTYSKSIGSAPTTGMYTLHLTASNGILNTTAKTKQIRIATGGPYSIFLDCPSTSNVGSNLDCTVRILDEGEVPVESTSTVWVDTDNDIIIDATEPQVSFSKETVPRQNVTESVSINVPSSHATGSYVVRIDTSYANSAQPNSAASDSVTLKAAPAQVTDEYVPSTPRAEAPAEEAVEETTVEETVEEAVEEAPEVIAEISEAIESIIENVEGEIPQEVAEVIIKEAVKEALAELTVEEFSELGITEGFNIEAAIVTEVAVIKGETVAITTETVQAALEFAQEPVAIEAIEAIEAAIKTGEQVEVAITTQITVYEVENPETGESITMSMIGKTFEAQEDLIDVEIVEVIPESVAETVDDLIFIREIPLVLQEDPVLKWVFETIKKGETKDMTYIVKNKRLEKIESITFASGKTEVSKLGAEAKSEGLLSSIVSKLQIEIPINTLLVILTISGIILWRTRVIKFSKIIGLLNRKSVDFNKYLSKKKSKIDKKRLSNFIKEKIKQELRKKKLKDEVKKLKNKRTIIKFLHDNFRLFKTGKEKGQEIKDKLKRERIQLKIVEEKEKSRLKNKRAIIKFLHDNFGLFKTGKEKEQEIKHKLKLKLEKERIQLKIVEEKERSRLKNKRAIIKFSRDNSNLFKKTSRKTNTK